MKRATAPAIQALRALRLLDPKLSSLQSRPGSPEIDSLSEALLHRRLVDEQRVARELAEWLLANEPDPITGLHGLAEELVSIRGGIPTWNGTPQPYLVGQDIDVDLIVAARLAEIYSPQEAPTVVEDLSWPSVLAANAFLVEQVLGSELADTHVHLGGALPNSFYWIGTLVNFTHLERTEIWGEDPTAWPSALRRAQRLRADLCRRLFGLDLAASMSGSTRLLDAIDDEEPEEAFVDPLLCYLLPNRRQRAGYNPALGERYLLWSCLSELLRRGPDFSLHSMILDYLRIRGSFQRHLTYGPGVRGLARFQVSFRLRHLLFNDPVHGDIRKPSRRRRSQREALRIERFRTRHALRYQFSDPTDAPWARDRGLNLGGEEPTPSPWRPGRLVELRVSPMLSSLQARVLYAYLRGLEDFLRFDLDAPPVRFGLVFHLLRNQDGESMRENAKWQVEGLLGMLRDLPDIRPFVVGLDAAGEEMLTPPRDLAESFNLVREAIDRQPSRPGLAPIRLGRTFHAGEDFRDLLTGLRYIDEAIVLFNLGPGERIGHGLAAAIDPEIWYGGRSHVYPRRSDHVLDLLWLLRYAQLPHLELDFLPDVSLQREIRNRLEGMLGKEVEAGIDQDFLQSLDDAEAYPTEAAVLRHLGVGAGGSPLPIRIDASYLKIVAALRSRVLRRISQTEVVIEACPTSNLLVGRFPSYAEIPYQAFNRCHLRGSADEQDQILLSINSDDPGMFNTTVANEYRLLGESMANAGFSRREVFLWLDECRRIGLASCFIPPWSPPTRRELLEKIRNLRHPFDWES